MGDQVLSSQVPQSVLEFHQLNEQVMLRVQAGGMHWTLKVKAQPFLDATHATSLCKVEKENKIQDDGGSKNAVTAQEVDLDLHGITQPSINVDVVPSFFIVTS